MKQNPTNQILLKGEMLVDLGVQKYNKISSPLHWTAMEMKLNTKIAVSTVKLNPSYDLV